MTLFGFFFPNKFCTSKKFFALVVERGQQIQGQLAHI